MRLPFLPFCLPILALLAAAPDAGSQTNWPTRPIRVILQSPPGGSMDLIVRLIQVPVQDALGQSLVLETRTGSMGIIAHDAVAKATDGHTVGIAATGTAALPTLHKTLPFDPLRDFAAIALLVKSPHVIAVNPAVPIHSISELVAAAKARPGGLSYGHSGMTTGPQTAFLVARGKDYFTQQGVGVTLDAGTGSAASVTRVATGTYDMGIGDISSLIEHLSKVTDPATRPQAVYMTHDATPAGIITLKKNHIATPKDLAGKTIGGPVFDSARKLFPIFARAQGFDPGSVKWQNLQPGLNLTQLIRGQLEAASGFPLFQVGNLESMGVKADELVLLNFKDYGVNIYGNGVFANPKFIKENPKAIAAFLRAYNHGIKDTIANPEEAIKYVHQREPTIQVPVELGRLKAWIQIVATPGVRANGLGMGERVRLQQQSEDVAKAFGLDKVPEADQIYTPAFLPPRAERML